MFFVVYNHFNFTDIEINLSTRPDKKVGDDATWDKESAFETPLKRLAVLLSLKKGMVLLQPKLMLRLLTLFNATLARQYS